MPDRILVDGESLTTAQVWQVAVHRAPAGLAAGTLEKIERARAVVDNLTAKTYGVDTGVGDLAEVNVDKKAAENGGEMAVHDQQLRLLRSHACGVDEPFPDEIVRAALLLRINAFAKGASGVRPATVQLLLALLNRDLLPVVPRRGSVGASGDLAPLAHLALPLVGEGSLRSRTAEPVPAAAALAREGLAPLVLGAKEGLSLINGTQFMTATLTLAGSRAGVMCLAADVAAAMTATALHAGAAPFLEAVHALRPHPGQRQSAENIRGLLAGQPAGGRIQDAYSVRCAPQVHGAVRDLLAYSAGVCRLELNAATDNPLVVAGEVVSNTGNFHGQPVAFALDTLAIALCELGSISERRTARLLDAKVSGLPAFLTPEPGLNSGMMIAQYLAAALVSENKVLAHPASVDSIPTSAGQEDHVSMGGAAALKAWQVVANVERVLAVELMAAAQALDLGGGLENAGPGVRAAHGAVRLLVEPLADDRVLADDVERLAEAVRDGWLAARALLARRPSPLAGARG